VLEFLEKFTRRRHGHPTIAARPGMCGPRAAVPGPRARSGFSDLHGWGSWESAGRCVDSTPSEGMFIRRTVP
jgi:hypothetical protein